MQVQVDELKEILMRELDCIDSLLTIMHNKHRAILENDYDGILYWVGKCEEVSSKMADEEEKRKIVTVKIAEKLGISPDDLKLSLILEHIEDQELSELRKTLLKKLLLLREINERNAFLVLNGLNFVRDMFKLFIQEEQEIYSKDGKTTKQRQILEGKA